MKESWSWRKFICKIFGHKPLPAINHARMTFCKRCGQGVNSNDE